MPNALTIIAGASARQHLLEYGFRQQDFHAMVAASGGPKWFTLFGLDKYLFGEFFAERKTPIYTLGSSAGAWQLACFAQSDPVRAITNLAQVYSGESYSDRPNAEEISTKAVAMLDRVFGEQGITELVNHPLVKTHILANRSRGLCTSENKAPQLLGLTLAAAGNAVSRKWLQHAFTRFVFHAGKDSFFKFDDHPTHYVALSAANGIKALMASGSIPLVLKGVTDIPGAPQGVYRDGGIVDYHFDFPFPQQGLVLYPHFSQRVIPGWFDKKLNYRKTNPRHYDNVVLLVPSKEFVASLPNGKLTDRTDFINMEVATRIAYWRQVLQESDRLAEDLHTLLNSNLDPTSIKTFPVA